MIINLSQVKKDVLKLKFITAESTKYSLQHP